MKKIELSKELVRFAKKMYREVDFLTYINIINSGERLNSLEIFSLGGVTKQLINDAKEFNYKDLIYELAMVEKTIRENISTISISFI